jgi:SAM-dependent methyltransferase
MDADKLMEFTVKAVTDVGSLLAGSMVVIGDRLGLYRAMAKSGPVTSAELATATGTAERYIREWLAAQAAVGYLTYLGDGCYALPEEHAVALTDESSPACVIGAFETAIGAAQSTDRIADAFLTGEGVFWGDHDAHVHTGCERFFRPGYVNHLTQTWIPAMDRMEPRLEGGIRVADIGCGHGASTIHLAQAYPRSTFTGFDAHAGSVEVARARAIDAGLGARVAFSARTARELEGTFDLVCYFDCLHDLGDPVGALQAAVAHLAPGGAILLVEPAAGDEVEANLHPIGAAYYALSTLLCTPNSLSQETGRALGAQAGEARLREVAGEAGLTRFDRISETPFNMVFEARP